jgi:hypothetical protein
LEPPITPDWSDFFLNATQHHRKDGIASFPRDGPSTHPGDASIITGTTLNNIERVSFFFVFTRDSPDS